MEAFFRNAVTNLIEFFKSLDAVRRVGFAAIGLIVMAIVIGIITWAAKTHYKVLYTDLNKDDSATVARMLKEAKITYQLDDSGKTIRVPEDKVDIWRLEIAKKGVSFTSAVGYEVFDKQSFGTTSFVQRINKQRALEGELIRTIKHIKGVNRARVHLSIPESSPFVSEKKPPSASVVLELKPGMSMTTAEIKGIASLVSSAIDGMRNEHVVIIDSKGKKLSENVGDSMAQETASRISLESKINRKYENKVEGILTRVVGAGKVIAKVNVKMDFTQSVETKTSYDSENTAVLSEVENKHLLSGSRPSPQGIPGARSNLPGEKPQPGIPETKNNVDKTLRTRNYNVPKKVTNSKRPTAEVKSVSVAVMIDGKRIPQMKDGVPILNDSGYPVTKYQPWSEAELANFQQIVSSALGLNEGKGDQLVIKNMEFAQEDLAAAEAILAQKEKRDLIKNLSKYLIIGVLISLFFFIIIRPFIQWITENTSESIEDFLPQTIEELEKLQANQKLPGLEEALPTIEEKLNPEKIEGNMLKDKIISLVESDPAKAAQVLHEMIHATDGEKSIA
ncbi:flagellar basal-body MS-ring/collar protein FliF [Bacteriovoracaceae bacterium]|nr:flagellar basal-body MS-ring/collar protein FliF [Bacteriovoracaceae bacterium]